MEGLWSRNRRSNPQGEGDSQDDGEGKLLDGSWKAGPGSRMEDSGKDLSRREREEWIHFLVFQIAF